MGERETSIGESHREKKRFKKRQGLKKERYRDTGWEGETDRKREPHREIQIRMETEIAR